MFFKCVSCKHKATGQLLWTSRDSSLEFTINPRQFHWRKIEWYIFALCFYGRFPRILFFKGYERVKRTEWSKVHVLQRPAFIMKRDWIICNFGHIIASGFLISFWGDHVFLSTQFERFAATDFMVVDAAGFLAATPGELAEAVFHSHQLVSRNLSWLLSGLRHMMAYLVKLHYMCWRYFICIWVSNLVLF